MSQDASMNGSYHTRLWEPYIIGLSDAQNRCICLSSLHMCFWAKCFLRRTYIRLAREGYQTRVWWHMRPIRYASVALVSWGLSDTPMRAVCCRAFRYIEWIHDYIHYVCISGANDFFEEYMHDWHMRPIRYASVALVFWWYIPRTSSRLHLVRLSCLSFHRLYASFQVINGIFDGE